MRSALFWDSTLRKILEEQRSHTIIFLTVLGMGVKYGLSFLMFCLSWISMHLCNKNQLDALLILSLFRHPTSTCFGYICSPSSGGTLYIHVHNNWYVLCFLVDCLLAGPTESQLKSTTRTNCCIYIVHLLMMGYKYARNM